MTFPTKADMNFFKEAKRIQELWEPSLGDWAWSQDKGWGVVMYNFEHCIAVAYEGWDGWTEYVIEDLIFLPRQGQLQEMLVEKGYTVCLTGPYMLPKNYQVILANEGEGDESIVEYGPTPSIALGRALVEVLKGKEEQPNE